MDRGRFATEQEIYHRLRWDPRFPAAHCSIVYALRPEGTKRVPFLAWDDAVPWHRIVEFWVGDELAWSRPQRIDRLDELASAAGADDGALGEVLGDVRHASEACDAPRALRVAVWNLLFDRYAEEDAAPRWRDALDRLAARALDVVVLVEVTPRMWELIAAHPAFAAFALTPAFEPYGQAVLSRFPVRGAHALQLSRDKRAVFATIDVAGRTVGVAALHLTSDRKPDARAIRAEQLAAVCAAIDGAPRDRGWIVAADFNGAPDEAGLAGDVWACVHGDAPGLTFDVARNPRAAAQSRSGRSGRFDRIHVRGVPGNALVPIACELIGEDAPPSDHFGVVASLALDVGRLALAIVPPRELWGPIQRARCAGDPKFASWPPHLTVELPTSATRAPAIAPFDVQLDRVIALGAVHALAPADPAPFRALGVATPHLTVSRTRRVPDGLSARWRVERIELLAEHAGRFEPVAELATPRESPVVARVLARMRAVAPAATLVPFGSAIYAWSAPLGAAADRSPREALGYPEGSLRSLACARDVDVIVTDAAAGARIASVFGLRDAGRDRWRGAIDDVPVDIIATDEMDGAADARALRDHLEHHGRHDAFVAALPRVRAFAHARGLLHNGLGYFGLFGWALLLADPLAHDEVLCAVPPARAFDAWLARLPALVGEGVAIAAPVSRRDVTRHLTPATRATLLAELRAPTLVDLAVAPPPGDTLAIAVADQGAYLARAHALIGALEAAGAEPRVWGRFDDGAHRITVRDRAIAEPIVAAFTA